MTKKRKLILEYILVSLLNLMLVFFLMEIHISGYLTYTQAFWVYLPVVVCLTLYFIRLLILVGVKIIKQKISFDYAISLIVYIFFNVLLFALNFSIWIDFIDGSSDVLI